MKMNISIPGLIMKALLATLIAGISNVYSLDRDQCRVNDPDISASYVGACKDGLADGEGIAQGRDKYIGQFRAGEPHGVGKYIWGPSSAWSGQVYDGEWLDGERTGKGKYLWPDGSIYEGQFIRGSLKGFGTLKTPLSELGTSGSNHIRNGIKQGDFYVRTGLFLDNSFIGQCKDKSTCFDVLLAHKVQEEEELKKNLSKFTTDLNKTFSEIEKRLIRPPNEDSKRYSLPQKRRKTVNLMNTLRNSEKMRKRNGNSN